MRALRELLRHFFTHKDFLPSPKEWIGTLFSPLQILFCMVCTALIILACIRCARRSERFQKRVFLILWLAMLLTEPIIVVYDGFAGATHRVDLAGALPLWPCSLFLFVLPFAVFGKGWLRHMACGYICTLGLLGGVVNFIYPASYISYYSCISFAGLRTIFYHGSMIFTAFTMLLSGYHGFRRVTGICQVLLPVVPALLASVPAHIVNLCISGADYLFLKLESFFFAPIGRATPYIVSTLIIYVIYFVIHCAPYLPSYVLNKCKRRQFAPLPPIEDVKHTDG